MIKTELVRHDYIRVTKVLKHYPFFVWNLETFFGQVSLVKLVQFPWFYYASGAMIEWMNQKDVQGFLFWIPGNKTKTVNSVAELVYHSNSKWKAHYCCVYIFDLFWQFLNTKFEEKLNCQLLSFLKNSFTF